MRKGRSNDGLTYIELLVWMVVLGLLIAPAVSALFTQSNYNKVSIEGTKLQLLLQELVLRANQEGVEFRLIENQEELFIQNEFEETLFIRTVPQAYSLEISSRFLSEIRFWPSGTVSPASISIRHHNALCTLRVSLRGRVRKSCQNEG